MIRIAIADGHPIARAALRAVLSRCGDICIVAEVEDAHDLLHHAAREHLDVVVVDLSTLGVSALDVVRNVIGLGPPTRVLVLSLHDREEFLPMLLAAGGAGHLVKSDAHRDLADAIRAVAAGDCFVRAPDFVRG